MTHFSRLNNSDGGILCALPQISRHPKEIACIPGSDNMVDLLSYHVGHEGKAKSEHRLIDAGFLDYITHFTKSVCRIETRLWSYHTKLIYLLGLLSMRRFIMIVIRQTCEM